MKVFAAALFFVGVGVSGAGAQTRPVPNSDSSASASVSAVTHCRDSRGTVKLKNGTSGPSETTGSAGNSASNPGATARDDHTAEIPRSTEAVANLPPCADNPDQ